MGSTSVYSEFRAWDDEAGVGLDRPPRVLDLDGLYEVGDRLGNMSETSFKRAMILDEETDIDSYPEETWRILKGFKTHKPQDTFLLDLDPDRQSLIDCIMGHEDRSSAPLGYRYNLDNAGIHYEGVDGFWKMLFAMVSEHTEPFECYTSPQAYQFTDVTDFDDGTESVYYVRCVDGAVYVEEQTFELADSEILIDEREADR